MSEVVPDASSALSAALPPCQKPKTLGEAVDKLVALRLEEVRASMAAEQQQRAAQLAARIGALEAQLAATAQLQSAGKGAPRAASAKPAMPSALGS